MKIALCFYGMGPLKCLKNASKNINKDIPKNFWLKNVIEPNNTDVFIHCWSPEIEEDYVETFKPKKHIFEKPKVFLKGGGRYDYGATRREVWQSVHYSIKQVNLLKQKYEEENSFKYDLVMIARFDIVWLKPIDISIFDPKFIHGSPWNYADDVNSYRKHFNNIQLIKEKDKHKHDNDTEPFNDLKWMMDHFFIMGSELSDIFSDLYTHIDKYIHWQTSEIMKYYYCHDKDIFKLYKRDAFKRFHDHVLFRYLYLDEKLINPSPTDELRGWYERRNEIFKELDL